MPQNLESQLSYLGFQLVSPSRVLRPYIRSFWQIRPESSLAGYHEEYMHPTGGYGIVLNLGETVKLDGRPISEPVFLDGTNTVSRKMGFFGQNEVIGVRFKEGGAFPFLGLPLSELQNEATLLDALEDRTLLELHGRLWEAQSLEARVELLEEWLIGRLSVGIERSSLVPASLAILRRRGWTLPIPKVADALAVGQRQLERLFRSQVGMSPRQYSRLLRVEAARQALRRTAEATTTMVGAELGYHDQSHFIRDFTAVVGMTPYAYLKWKRNE